MRYAALATYSQIWKILQDLHGVKEPVGKGYMRAKLQVFQNLGIPIIESGVGKGKKFDYTSDHILQIVLAVELHGWRLPPSFVSELVKEFWSDQSFIALIKEIMQSPKLNEELLYCIFYQNSEILSFAETFRYYTNKNNFFSGSYEDARNAGYSSFLTLNLTKIISDLNEAYPELSPPLIRSVASSNKVKKNERS